MADKKASSSWPFAKNLLGCSVDDESLKSIPHAKTELYWHVTLKSMQMGSILGALIGAGYGAIRGPSAVKSMMNGSRNGMLIGLPLGVLMTYQRMAALAKDSDQDMDYAYYDRAYRIRNNLNQVRVDRAALLGTTAWTVAGAATGANILGYAAFGMGSSTALQGILNNTVLKK